MFSCQIKTSVFPHLIRFLGKLVKLKLKTILKSDYEQCAFHATRLHAYDDHQQQAVSKFKLREKERQHSHGNFGRMLGGFYNFFFQSQQQTGCQVYYVCCAAVQCFSCATLKHHHPLRLDRSQWGDFLSGGAFFFSYTTFSHVKAKLF